jgi:hypothetical protein
MGNPPARRTAGGFTAGHLIANIVKINRCSWSSVIVEPVIGIITAAVTLHAN